MSDAGGSAGARLPQTFGEKLSFAAPVLLATLAVAVLISFVLVWVVSGQLRTELKKVETDLTTKNDALNKELTEEKKKTADLQKKADELTAANVDLNKKNEDLKNNLGKAVTELDKTSKSLAKIVTDLGDFTYEGQKQVDATQNQGLAQHEQKIKYIEGRLEILKTLEADVNTLKGDTSELKKEYVVLKGDLGKVRDKAEITDKDLSDLTERSRIFQLKVLSARAKEAAEQARSNDIKSLVQRLNQE
ncbi:MAG: hypothetical protein HY291_22415 [Planctomycetes bacterium]|nr:hypothetical protein [Planctomycetota bacterium]